MRVLELMEAGGGAAAAAATLKGHLIDGTAFQWLELAHRCGLDALADACTEFIIQRRLPLTLAALRALPEACADALLRAADAREKELEERVACQLAAAAQPCEPPCSTCGYKWFIKPNGKTARHCLNCGYGR